MMKPKHAPGPGSLIVKDARDAPPRRPKMTGAEQGAEFERVARELGAEGDQETFNEMLRKLARPKLAEGSGK